jgi:hypothetical protein
MQPHSCAMAFSGFPPLFAQPDQRDASWMQSQVRTFATVAQKLQIQQSQMAV